MQGEAVFNMHENVLYFTILLSAIVLEIAETSTLAVSVFSPLKM